VEAGALAQLFAILMGRSKIKNSKGEAGDRDVVREVEERCVSIISNLFQVKLEQRCLRVGGCQLLTAGLPGCVVCFTASTKDRKLCSLALMLGGCALNM
jgi:hypothetical protein